MLSAEEPLQRPLPRTGADPATLARIADAIRFLTLNRARRPSLAQAAQHAGLSPAHFHRIFTAHAGISPKRFLAYLTLEEAKTALDDNEPVLGAAYAAGLSTPSRLHDLFVSLEAVTPGEFRRKGRGLDLAYGFAPTPFGLLLCMSSKRGIVGLAFADERAPAGARPPPTAPEDEDLWAPDAALADIKSRFADARFVEDPAPARRVAAALFSPDGKPNEIKLVASGTNFQVRVWEALLRLPMGRTTTYGALAREVCGPNATRAVASAVGRNPIALVIPCHRVLRQGGALGGYHWGLSRKRAMLAWERAMTESPSS